MENERSFIGQVQTIKPMEMRKNNGLKKTVCHVGINK